MLTGTSDYSVSSANTREHMDICGRAFSLLLKVKRGIAKNDYGLK